MRNLLLPILLICSTTTVAGVYRWIDANGQIHFSDKPHRGAEQIQLKQTSVYTPPESLAGGEQDNAEEPATAEPEQQDDNAGPAYESIEIVSPEKNQVVRSSDGTVNISIDLRPGLQEGHKIRVFLNGTQTAEDLAATQITLQDMDRGTHSLEVGAVTEQGEVLIRSGAINFHMLRLAEPRKAPFEGNSDSEPPAPAAE